MPIWLVQADGIHPTGMLSCFTYFFSALNFFHIFDSENCVTNDLKEDIVFVHFIILLHKFSQKVLTFQNLFYFPYNYTNIITQKIE